MLTIVAVLRRMDGWCGDDVVVGSGLQSSHRQLPAVKGGVR